MSIITEPELLSVAVSDATSALANTLKTTSLLASPGVGFRYRVYAVTLAFGLNTATPAAGTGVLLNLLNIAPFLLAVEWTAQPSDHVVMPMGVPLPANTAMSVSSWSATAAAISFAVRVAYVTEAV